MNLIDTIVADIGNVEACERVRPFDIKELGYKFSKHRIPVHNSEYLVCELLDEDTMRPASFCFVLSKKTNMGIVLAHPYEKYYFISVEEKKEAKKIKRPKQLPERFDTEEEN